MREGGCAVHVPAVAVMGSAGVDENEAIRISIRGQFGPRIPLLAGTTTRMQLANVST